jgi:hypothetical protein
MRIRIPPQILHTLVSQNFFTFIRSRVRYCFYLFRHRHRCHQFLYFEQFILSLHLAEMDTDLDPDRQAVDADPDPPK